MCSASGEIVRLTPPNTTAQSMHIQTHILSGWCLANVFPLTPGQRLGAMIAASAADLDGLGILFGQEAYWKYHHALGHNLLFGLVLSIGITLMTRGKLWLFALFLGLFHLHLLMDFFGSGPGWPIAYLWPFSEQKWNNSRWSWAFYSWQNITTATMLVAWTVLIAIRKQRTPLEAIMPNLDRQLVQVLSGKWGGGRPKSETSRCTGCRDSRENDGEVMLSGNAHQVEMRESEC